jgi:hypothetical protein
MSVWHDLLMLSSGQPDRKQHVPFAVFLRHHPHFGSERLLLGNPDHVRSEERPASLIGPGLNGGVVAVKCRICSFQVQLNDSCAFKVRRDLPRYKVHKCGIGRPRKDLLFRRKKKDDTDTCFAGKHRLR